MELSLTHISHTLHFRSSWDFLVYPFFSPEASTKLCIQVNAGKTKGNEKGNNLSKTLDKD